MSARKAHGRYWKFQSSHTNALRAVLHAVALLEEYGDVRVQLMLDGVSNKI